MSNGERWLTIIVSGLTLLGAGAHVVVRFNTLENANEMRVQQVALIHMQLEKFDNRITALERNGQLKDDIAELRKDVAVLNEKVDRLEPRRR